jgi:hypothetical protein
VKKKLTTMTAVLKVLPPAKDVCQECATKHEPGQPHNQQSLYYQIFFYERYGRYPTWVDAISHCTQAVKDAWKKELIERGEWKE